MDNERQGMLGERESLPEVPKLIHYCWFGGRPKPKAVLSYLQNWREILGDYEIVEWNESNFDVSSYQYAAEAYRAGKFAFVSDVARLQALYSRGGIYMDTDVQVLRSFDSLLSGEVVVGFEEFNYVATSTLIAPKGSSFIDAFLHSYSQRRFLMDDGTFDLTTNVEILTRMLMEIGLNRNGDEQVLRFGDERIHVLNQAKFSPMDYPNGIINADASTFAIHHFGQSWASPVGRARRGLRNLVLALLGGKNLKRLRRAISGGQ